MFIILRAVFGWGKSDAETYAEGLKNYKAHLQLINTHLKDKTYLVGNQITAADIVLCINTVLPFQTVLDPGFRKGMPNLSAWIENILKNPHVSKRLGNVKLCQKAIKPDFPPKEEKKVEKAAAKPKETDDSEEPAAKKE